MRQTYEEVRSAARLKEIEAEVRKLAHSLPRSDFGSTRAIQAVAQYVCDKIESLEESHAEALYETAERNSS